LLGLVLSVPVVGDLFDFSRLSPLELDVCLAVGIASFLWFEMLKGVSRQRNSR
jgi:hypothetical protein